MRKVYLNRIRSAVTTVIRSARLCSSREESRSRINARTALRPNDPGRNSTIPAWVAMGNRKISAIPLSKVIMMRFSLRALETTPESGAPHNPSSSTVSESCPRNLNSLASSTGRFSSTLNFTADAAGSLTLLSPVPPHIKARHQDVRV